MSEQFVVEEAEDNLQVLTTCYNRLVSHIILLIEPVVVVDLAPIPIHKHQFQVLLPQSCHHLLQWCQHPWYDMKPPEISAI